MMQTILNTNSTRDCNTTRCRMINKVMCGSLHTPSAIVCSIENLKVKLSEYYLQRNIANL